MSVNIPYAVVIGEGVHDVMATVRVLLLKGFREVVEYRRIPELLAKSMIPTKYPSGDRLTWVMPHPSFLARDGRYVVVSNANGKTELGKNLFRLVGAAREEALSSLKAAAIIADADCMEIADKRKELHAQITESFQGHQDFELEGFLSGVMKAGERAIPSFLYILPDNVHTGTLETVLIEGAHRQYPELLPSASAYIEEAKTCHGETLKHFNADKAIVGVVSNVLRPGRPNQTSIRSDEWFTAESLCELPLHRQFSDFVEGIIRALYA